MVVKVEKKAEAAAPTQAKKYQVMLGNAAKRYAYKDQVYEAGIKYNVSERLRDDLFSRVDDNGVRFFYDAAVVEASVKKAIQRKRRQAIPMEVSPTQYANIMTEIIQEQQDEAESVREVGEIDTGAGKGEVEV